MRHPVGGGWPRLEPARLRRGLPGRRHRPGRVISAHAASTRKPEAFLVGAGVPLSSVVQEAFRRSLWVGVRGGNAGNVGGALRMNAGTRDEGIADSVVRSPRSMLERPDEARRGRISWGYRSSSFAPTRSSWNANFPSNRRPASSAAREDGGVAYAAQEDAASVASELRQRVQEPRRVVCGPAYRGGRFEGLHDRRRGRYPRFTNFIATGILRPLRTC